MKAKLFSIMLTYAAQGAIAKAQLRRAADYRRLVLARTALASLVVFVQYSKKLGAIQSKAEHYHLDYRLRQCLLALR